MRKTKKQIESEKAMKYQLIILLALMIGSGIIGYCGKQTEKLVENLPEPTIITRTITLPVVEAKTEATIDHQKAIVRTVSAYNAGDPAQTDASPCIGAAGTDICEALDRGEIVFAANFVPLGTKLKIEGIGIGTVMDRMNKRYTSRVDFAMKLSDKSRAKKFGVQSLHVEIIK